MLKMHKLDFYLLRKTKEDSLHQSSVKCLHGFVFIRFCTMEPTPNRTRLNTWSFAGLQRSGTAKCRGLARFPFSAPFPFYELSSVLQILLFLLLDQAMARTYVRMSRSGSVLSANVVAEHQRHSSRAIENGIARVASECRDSIAS